MAANVLNDQRSALAGLRVLDLANQMGLYAGKLLADMGADVIKVERPGGDATRNIGPFYRDQPHPERSLYFWHYNTNKRGITLDLESQDGREVFKKLVSTADIVMETFPPGYLDRLGLGFAELKSVNPKLVVTSISGFGQTGPYAHYQSSDIVGTAMGGMMSVCGEPERSPLNPTGGQAFHCASHYAAIGSLVAIQNRRITGNGQHIDISMQEAVASCLEHVNDWYHYGGVTAGRPGRIHWSRGYCVLPCKDGWVMATLAPNWDGLVEWMESEGFGYDLRDPKWLEPAYRIENMPRLFLELMSPWIAQHTRKDLVEKGQNMRVAFAPVNSPEMAFKDPHLNERGFFVPVVHPELDRTFTYPGAPYKFGESPWRVARRAPLIGEHNEEILGAELGLTKEQIAALAEPHPARRTPQSSGSSIRSKPVRPTQKSERKPLEGIKVVDFTWVLAGPFCSRLLAFFGAEVIKVEAPEIGDKVRGALINMFKDNVLGINLNGYFNNNNAGKMSLAIDPNQPQGQEIIKKLVARADVVVENFSSRVMRKWGLDYENLKKVKSDIILVSMSGMGHTGPYKEFVSLGPTLQAISGITNLTGYAGGGPVGFGYSYADPVGGLNGALATLMALEYRHRTGKGQHVDLAQLEATTALLETALLDYSVNGRNRESLGNRLPHFPAAPHGVYRCKGDDRWLALGVFNEEEWQGFCRAIGSPDRTNHPHFRTTADRLTNADELDRLIEQWTRDQEAREAMRLLQEAGVPAGVVQNAEDLYCHDLQMKERGFFVELMHPEIGPSMIEGVPIKLSDTPGAFERPGPLLSEHNDYVLRGLLGLSEEQIDELIVNRII